MYVRAVTERVFVDTHPSPPQFENWGTSPKGGGKFYFVNSRQMSWNMMTAIRPSRSTMPAAWM